MITKRIMKKYFYFGVLFLSLIGQACEEDVNSELDTQKKVDDKAIRDYLAEKNISAEKLESGVYIRPLVENPQGTQVQVGHVVSILYSMKLILGDYPIETYNDTLNPVKFSYTENSLIPVGLNVEIGQMKKGEKFRFFIPSHQAFLDYENISYFGAYSNFVMDVEVVDLKTEQQEYEAELDAVQHFVQDNYPNAESYANGLYVVSTKPGNGRIPNSNGRIRFHFTRKYLDGTVIETTEGGNPIDVFFSERRLVQGLEQGIKQMTEGEHAILIMPSALAFGKSLQVIPQKLRQDLVRRGELEPEVAPYSPVLYEVELLAAY